MEDLGYDMGWCGHHRFAETSAFGGETASEPSAPLAMLAPLIARTKSMQFCTNIMLVPSRHPLELAEEINTINEMANNRFILGGGIGYKPDEFENCGWSFKTRAKRFEECLEVLRLAMSGERFSYRGNHFTIDDVQVQPPPLRGHVPPIWIGAVSEPAMQRAGRLGDGWIVSFAEHLLELQGKVATYKAIAADHGSPSTIALMRDVHIAPTRAQLDPDFLPNIIKVWQSYDDIGSKADRDPLADEVMFGGKQVSLDRICAKPRRGRRSRRLHPGDAADQGYHRSGMAVHHPHRRSRSRSADPGTAAVRQGSDAAFPDGIERSQGAQFGPTPPAPLPSMPHQSAPKRRWR